MRFEGPALPISVHTVAREIDLETIRLTTIYWQRRWITELSSDDLDTGGVVV